MNINNFFLIEMDFEVYKFDWVAGFKISNTGEYIQIHNDIKELKEFLAKYRDAIYFTINGERYDNNILEATLNDENPFYVSQAIINNNEDRYARRLPIMTYDLSKGKTFMPSLKVFESNNGMSIEELPISPTYVEKLTDEQLNILKKYNRHDLDATELSMKQRFEESFMVKVRLIRYFNLDLKWWISRTLVSIVTKGLGAKRGEFSHQNFTFANQFSCLQINNETVKKHLENENFYNDDLTIKIAGVVHHIRKGGIHAAVDGYYETNDCWHADFASFYPSLMIVFGLLSRALDDDGKKKFIKLRDDRYEAKKKKDITDIALKEAINSMFGAAQSDYSDLYDPSRSTLVCMYGQAFAIDLTEKLEPYIKLIQSNTDGIIFELKENTDECKQNMIRTLDEFTQRTQLKLDLEHWDRLCQKDVNNYVAVFEGKIQSKGNMTNLWDLTPDHAYYRGTYRVFQTTVVDRATTLNLLFGTSIEEIIQEEFDKKNWFRFQATSKTGKMYHAVRLIETNYDIDEQIQQVDMLIKNKDVKKFLKDELKITIKNYNDFMLQKAMNNFSVDDVNVLNEIGIKIVDEEEKITDIQHINRVFASNDRKKKRVIKKYKYVKDVEKNSDGEKLWNGKMKESASLISNIPDNVFVFNGDMSDFTDEHAKQIDLQWYIDQAYYQVNFYKTKGTKKIQEDIDDEI